MKNEKVIYHITATMPVIDKDGKEGTITAIFYLKDDIILPFDSIEENYPDYEIKEVVTNDFRFKFG